MRTSRRTGGFTLVELMVSMSLFLVLGTALVALLTNAFEFLRSGTAGSEVADKGADFLRPFVADIENVLAERSLHKGRAIARFHSDFVQVEVIEDERSAGSYMAQRLVFVRSTRGEASDSVTRLAGTKPGATDYLDGHDDGKQAVEGKLRAPGGMQEILYMALPAEGMEPGILTLWRATRAPVGGKGSLFDVKKPEDVKRVGQPLISGVLRFEVLFWTPETRTWEVSHLAGGGEGPSLTWDSTRGILPGVAGLSGFRYAAGAESLVDPRDDISPRKIKVLMVYERTGRENETAFLQTSINDGSKKLSVNSSAFTATSSLSYVKIGLEWLRYAGMTTTGITISKRGAWGTYAAGHELGAKVHAGYVVQRTVLVPSYRENYNLTR